METTEAEKPLAKRKGIIRRLYDWVLHWADTPYGAPALFVLAFVESSFFPIPPDVLLIALALGSRKRAFYYALICSIGSVLGAFLGYAIGYWFWESVGQRIVDFYHLQDKFDLVRQKYEDYAFQSILIAAFTPIPYKVFTIAAGISKISLWVLFSASVIGRSARFFLVAGVLYIFGPPAKRFIDKYFDWLAILFVVLIVLGFVVIKWAL
ncbi:MAG: YqaA family protein [Planctomycetota bacterium]